MFEHLIMLAGLGGAALPLVIHLLSRARYRVVDWGAVMFLEAPTQRSRQHVGRLREIALLMVRMAIVALLAVALARPVAQTLAAPSLPAAAGANEPRVAAAVVVDCSASMAHEDGGSSRMSQARAAVLQIISTLKRGDQVAVVPAVHAASTSSAAALDLTGDLQSAANRAGELAPTLVDADFPASLMNAADALARQQEYACRLYLVCDRQASNWQNVDDDWAAAFRRELATSRASFYLVPIGSGDAENVAIESVEPTNPPLVAGTPALVDVRVRNYGSRDALGLPLTIRAGGRELFASTVNLAARQSMRITCPIAGAPAQSQVATAQLRSGADDLDDRRDFVLDPSPPLRALIVRQLDNADDAGPDFLTAALAPYPAKGRDGAAAADANVASVEVVQAGEWDEQSLPQYQLLILDDVAALTNAQARAVEQFVYAGGGLIVAPGPAARIDQYNRQLYREENGVLPALLQPPVNHPTPQRIEPATIDTSHPMMRFLATHGAVGALPGAVSTSFATTGRTPAARVLASLSSGDPLVLESSLGRGRVILFTCALDARWSSLPLTNVYLPLVQSAARYAAGGAAPAANVGLGQSLVARFEVPANDLLRVPVQRPDARSDWADVTVLEDHAEARYARTDVPGVYTIKLSPQSPALSFAVAPSVEESDLTPLDGARWQKLEKEMGFTRVTDARVLAARLSATRPNTELWLAALAGVLGLIVIELALTRAWQGEASR